MGLYGSPELKQKKISDDDFIRCRKCGNEYMKEWKHCPNCKGRTDSLERILIYLIIGFGLLLAITILPDILMLMR